MARYVGNTFQFIRDRLQWILDPTILKTIPNSIAVTGGTVYTYRRCRNIISGRSGPFRRLNDVYVGHTQVEYEPILIPNDTNYLMRRASVLLQQNALSVNGVPYYESRGFAGGLDAAGISGSFTNQYHQYFTALNPASLSYNISVVRQPYAAMYGGITVMGVMRVRGSASLDTWYNSITAPAGGETFQYTNMIKNSPNFFRDPPQLSHTGALGLSLPVTGSYSYDPYNQLSIMAFEDDSYISLLPTTGSLANGLSFVELYFQEGTFGGDPAGSEARIRTNIPIVKVGTNESNSPWQVFAIRLLAAPPVGSVGRGDSLLNSTVTTWTGSTFYVDGTVASFDRHIKSFVNTFNPLDFSYGGATGCTYRAFESSDRDWNFGFSRSDFPNRPFLEFSHLMIYDRILSFEELEVNRQGYKRRFPRFNLA